MSNSDTHNASPAEQYEVFEQVTKPSVQYAVHPSEAKNTNYKPPALFSNDEIDRPHHKVGAAKPHSDGSWTINLATIPSTMQLVIRRKQIGAQS
jgi:hypothetical protein